MLGAVDKHLLLQSGSDRRSRIDTFVMPVNPSTLIEIEQLFTLESDELACAKARRTPLHRLAVALHIVFLKTTGRLLNSVEIVPVSVLEYLGRQLGCTPPRITSIRALYRRRRTLFDHQQVALDVVGLDPLGEHAKRGLVAYLRREATAVFDLQGTSNNTFC